MLADVLRSVAMLMIPPISPFEAGTICEVFGLDRTGWQAEFASIGGYLAEYGPRLPQALLDEQRRIAQALT